VSGVAGPGGVGARKSVRKGLSPAPASRFGYLQHLRRFFAGLFGDTAPRGATAGGGYGNTATVTGDGSSATAGPSDSNTATAIGDGVVVTDA
jgi:hypothetical protein